LRLMMASANLVDCSIRQVAGLRAFEDLPHTVVVRLNKSVTLGP